MENLYTKNREVASIIEQKTQKISYSIKKQIRKWIKKIQWDWIRIHINLQGIEKKLEKIFLAQYQSWVVDINNIYEKIEKAYTHAIEKIDIQIKVENLTKEDIENKLLENIRKNTIQQIKNEIKKIFVEEGSTIYFLKKLYNTTKNSTRYIREVEETSKLFRFYLSYRYEKDEIKLLWGEIYKKQEKYTWALNIYWMCFRLAYLWILNDIKPILINFILTKWAEDLQRLDIYLDYVGPLILKKKYKKIDIDYYKSKSKDTGIEAETIQYKIAESIKLRNYNTVEDKKNKKKINFYPEYKNKNVKRIEIELKFGRTVLYKIRKSKLWKILSSIKNWNLQGYIYFEYLFYALFGYKIENPEEFWIDKELAIQLQELFWYTYTEQIEYKELKKEINMDIEHMIHTTEWWLKKLYENGIKLKKIKKIKKDTIQAYWQEKKIKQQSFYISTKKIMQEIQEQKRKKDKELFYVENYKQEIVDYYIYISEMLEEEQIYFADIQIQERAKKKRKEIQEQIQDSRELQKYITDIEKKLIQKRKNKDKEMFKKLGFLDYLQDTETQIKYIETTF